MTENVKISGLRNGYFQFKQMTNCSRLKMTSEETTMSENFVEDGKNKTKLFCERCNSTVLLPMKAVYCEVEVILADFS